MIKINKKKKYIILITIIALAVMLAVIYVLRQKKYDGNGITYAQMAKMIMFADTDDTEVKSLSNSDALNDNQKSGYWYETYVNYINEKGWLNISRPNAYVTYKDLKKIAAVFLNDAELLNGLDAKTGRVNKDEFIDIYFKIIDRSGKKDIKEFQIAVVATPSMMENADKWEAYTTKGKLKFTGLILDKYKDKTIDVIVKNDEILIVRGLVSDSAEYKNVWIKGADDASVSVNAYGADRVFNIKGISDGISNVLADVKLSNGKVKQINTKTDTITGKVLSVTDGYVEIEGYGKVMLDEYFMIYDLNNNYSVKTYKDIVVGYSLQDFIVADGKICGAAISKKIDVDNIRVIIKTNGFKSIFHDSIELTCDKNYTAYFGDEKCHFAAGERLSMDKNDERFAKGRLRVEPEENGSIQLLSVNRSQGNPWYNGKMEAGVFDGGIVVVNDVGIESYLKRVVPSEMPSGFGVEALKVQAVCARSYAYKELTNSNYSMYGAHVDDSTMYQVYNNTIETPEADQAIDETKGQVITYNGEVVQTYYYSTSCGVNTDVGIWGTNTADYPYFKSTYISAEQRNSNLLDENEFEKFITSKNENDFDYGCPWYRWQITIPCDILSNSFNSKLHEKYCLNPKKVLTQNENGQFISKNISTIGNISSISVNERAAGGAVKSITVTGTLGTVQINSESFIRSLLCSNSCEMKNETDTTKTDSLPSTFCIIRPVCENGQVTAFRITGGGYGHGIGMSQNAVSKMTEKSYSYSDIISFFYSGTKIEYAD